MNDVNYKIPQDPLAKFGGLCHPLKVDAYLQSILHHTQVRCLTGNAAHIVTSLKQWIWKKRPGQE
jgi:hypothetical protein